MDLTPAPSGTRAAVRSAALRLFRERGYDGTTMRAVAEEAGVSTGIAYYYFASKNELVQELYVEVNEEHATRATQALDALASTRRGTRGAGPGATGGTLSARLRAVAHAGLDVFDEYHGFGTELLGTALRPGAATSPFSPASAPAREVSLGVFRDVVAGARPAVPADLQDDLARLLWLTWLGVTLFWVHDASPGRTRTRALVDGGAPLVGRAVRLARLPGARRLLADALALADRVGS